MVDDLSKLNGVGAGTVKKLDEAGISSYMALAVESPENLASIMGMSEKVARKLIKEAREKLSLGIEKAKEFANRKEKIKRISTGCSDFDLVIGGGFESGAITEVYGRTSSGKSQLSHLMVVRALLENENSKSIYIDSESTFRSSRIKDFCEANKVVYDDAMNRIYIARSFNSSHQILLVDEIEKILQKDNNYRLLVIDSLTSHFRSEFLGMGMLARRQQLLNKHLHQLLKMADIYNLVVIVTNQVSTSPGMSYGNPEVPIGGNILSHGCSSIVYLRPAKARTWVVKLMDSPCLPMAEASYLITKNGFENVK